MAKTSLNGLPQLLAGFVQLKNKPAEQALATSQHGSNSSTDAQAFPSEHACLSGAKQRLWAPERSQHKTDKIPADHSPYSAARIIPPQLLHHHNQS